MAPAPAAGQAVGLLEWPACNSHLGAIMELNPITQRIADLQGRLEALRGYL